MGTEGDRALDISRLRDSTGHITLDEGYVNTGSCRSAITFVDGEKGILRYRGIPIEQLAAQSTFVETCWLLIYGELPTREQLKGWSELFTKYEMIHEGLYHHFDGFPSTGHPMAILSAMINAMSCYEPDLMEMENPATFQVAAARLISKIRTIAGASLQGLHRAADHLSQAAPGLLLQLSPHDVLRPLQRLRARPGHGGRPPAHPHPSCRPRAELLVEHRAHGRFVGSQHVRQLRRRSLRAVGTAARRSQRRGGGDAPGTCTTTTST